MKTPPGGIPLPTPLSATRLAGMILSFEKEVSILIVRTYFREQQGVAHYSGTGAGAAGSMPLIHM